MIVKRKYLLTCTLIMTLLSLLLSNATFANNDKEADDETTVCQRTAVNMFRSCTFELREEFFGLTANCLNYADASERNACFLERETANQEGSTSCGDQQEARFNLCELLGEDRYDPEGLLDTNNFVEEPDASNPYFSLLPGHTYVARAGENFEELIVVTVTDQVREILGVNCRLVVDVVLVENEGELEALEITDDFYAQALNGDVHYCGEISRNFEDGTLVDLEGSFEAGRDRAKSGILIKADPLSGESHRQEFLLGDAEDAIHYLFGSDNLTSVSANEGGENPNFPCAGFCVKTEEFIPPEPSSGEYKYFIAGTGFVLGVALEDGEPSGERDELLCSGDSLAVLNDLKCAIEDPTSLLEQLCELSPAAFCD